MNIGKQLLDNLTAQAQESPRLRMNMDLRNSYADSSQRMLNAIEPGSVVPIHRHQKTSETVVVLRGRVVEEYYDDAGVLVESFVLGDCHVADAPRNDVPVACALNIPAGQWAQMGVIGGPKLSMYEMFNHALALPEIVVLPDGLKTDRPVAEPTYRVGIGDDKLPHNPKYKI